MTDQQHAAGDPGHGSDAQQPGSGPRGAVPAPGMVEEPRAHEGAHPHAHASTSAHAGAGADQVRDQTKGTEGTTGGPGRPGRPGDPAGPAGPAEQAGPAVPARLRRDRRFKMLGGVCAGLGRQCDMDPVIFRIVLAVLAAASGLGLIFYGFVWLFVPYDDEEENEVRKLLTGRVDGQAMAAVLFALVGCGVFLTLLGNGSVLAFAVVLSLLLAGAGYWSQQRGAPDPDPLAAQAVADAPPEAQAPPVPASRPSWWRDPIVKDGTHVGGTGYLWGPWDARDRDISAAINIAHGTPYRQGPRTACDPKPRGPRWIGGWVFLLALLADGLGTSLTWEDHGPATSLQIGLACALIVFGLGIALSAFLGRTGIGSIFLAVVTAGLLAASAALPANISTHWTRTEWTPTTMARVQPQYQLGTGVATLDLTQLSLSQGQTVTTGAEVGAGKLRVIVPPDVTVKLNIEVGMGDIQLPGEDKEDVDVAPDQRKQLTLPPTSDSTSDAENGGTLDLDLEVGLGQAEVARAAS